MPEEEDAFGSDGIGHRDPRPSNVIEFPGMRPNQKVTDSWARGVEDVNKKRRTRHEFPAPIDIVSAMMQIRKYPRLPWPTGWPQLERRCRTYVGDCVAFVGAIGAGKTQFGVQVCRAVMAAGLPCLWANLELGKEQVVARILANMNGEHAMAVLDHWSEERIRRDVAAVTDLWHFVDRHNEVDLQLAAMRDALEVALKVYRTPALLVVDHIGQLITDARDARLEMLRIGKVLEQMALDTKCWILILAQGTKAGQGMLTGKIEIEAAADAIGAAAESQIMQQVAANVIVSLLYKEDDALELEGRQLVAKARWTGEEGQVGWLYRKRGGVHVELGHLPATPQKVEAEESAQKKNEQHRTEPVQSRAEIRRSLGLTAASDAASKRRVKLLDAIRGAGAGGLEEHRLREVPGVGRGLALAQDLQELERACALERLPDRRWRIVIR